jgi:hypothetical protein
VLDVRNEGSVDCCDWGAVGETYPHVEVGKEAKARIKPTYLT